MQFKEAVKYYLGNGYSNLNEMAIKHLEGTQEMWDKNDIEGIADKYIENALADGKDYSNILRGLTVTFKSKGFDHNRENADKVKETIRTKVREMQKKQKEIDAKNAISSKPRLIKKNREE